MIKIRSLQKKDSDQVAPLIFQLTRNVVNPKDLTSRIRRLAVSSASRFFVAEIGGRIVGFGGLAWHAIPSKGLIAWVEEIIIDESHRNQGVGRALMQKIMAVAKSKRVQQLRLTVSNPVARKLYGDLGFSKKDSEYLFKILF